MAFPAPRILNEPIGWRFSSLSQISAGAWSTLSLTSGVRSASPRIRSRAASMAARGGASRGGRPGVMRMISPPGMGYARHGRRRPCALGTDGNSTAWPEHDESRYYLHMKRDAETASVIHSDPQILGGTPVFAGTRVPVKSLFDYLEG